MALWYAVYLQDQKQTQCEQQFLVGILFEQQEQQKKQEKITGINAFQMKPVKETAQCPGNAVTAVGVFLGRGRRGGV